MKKSLLITLLYIATFAIVQASSIDSLIALLSQPSEPLHKCNVLNQLGAHFESTSDYPKALYYLNQSQKIADSSHLLDQKIQCYNLIGYVYWHKSEYDSAFYYHQKAFNLIGENEISSELKSFTFLMLGNDYYDTGEFDKSSEYYFKSLKEAEKAESISWQVKSHNRLSKLFYKLNDFKLSKEHAQKAVNLNVEQDHRDLGDSYNTFGNVFKQAEDLDSALYYFQKTYYHFNKSGDIIGQSIAQINLGDTYFDLYAVTKAKAYLDSSYHNYQQSYILNSQVGNKFGMIYGLWGMADVSIQKSDNQEVLLNYQKALSISREIGAKSEICNLYLKIHHVYESANQTDSSLHYLKKYVALKDEIENSEKSKFLILQESKYAAEKLISAEKVEMEKQRLVEKEKNKWKNITLILIIIAVIILLYLLYIAFKRLHIIRFKNDQIKNINQVLQVQKQGMLDSINYAQRIQNAILPSKARIEKHLPESFVLYKPKDVVAGDFYWLEQVDETTLVAVADCTGHGVPGAMTSVVCNNAMNRAVREFGIIGPGKILDKTREIVLSEFGKGDDDIDEGMDIALCSITHLNETNVHIKYAGAYNPLWIIRDGKVIKLAADRQPVSKFYRYRPFTAHTLEAQQGDIIYLFSDGFVDQFGGPKDKKFGYKRFLQLLLQIHEKPMSEQREILLKTFEKWIRSGKSDQIDDVCIVGIKIK